MSRPFKLLRLQQIDSQLDTLSNRLSEIDKILNNDETIILAQKQVQEKYDLLQVTQKDLKKCEDNVRQQRLKIEQVDATLYGGKVRNPKELQDLQNEIAALRRHLSTLEDKQLQSMFDEEEAQAAYKQTTDNLDFASVTLKNEQRHLLEEQAHLLHDVSRFQDERQVAVVTVVVDDLALYQQLRQQRRGLAVAKVVDRACSACGSTLNASLLHAAHSSNQINRCDTCGRILYIG